MTNRGPVRVGVALTIVAVLAMSAGCTSTDQNASSPSPTAAPTSSVATTPTGPSAQYRLELGTNGDPDRHELVVPVPTGRTMAVTVSLGSDGETVAVDLVATLLRSDADGAGQEIELRITGVDADDPETVDGLASIVDSSSVLRRDRRLAVVEQVLDVPDGLAFRADAVARQALRAPFSLAGPLPLEAVGVGAAWEVQSVDGGETVDARDVSLLAVDGDGYRLAFALPDGEVEIIGRIGALLPDRQVITLVDAQLTVTADRLG